jgi:hypothetical protein
MNALTDFQQTGSILVRRKDPDAEFEGVIGKTMHPVITTSLYSGNLV